MHETDIPIIFLFCKFTNLFTIDKTKKQRQPHTVCMTDGHANSDKLSFVYGKSPAKKALDCFDMMS